MEYKFNKEQKEVFLQIRGWEPMRGYCFKTPPAEDDMDTYVEEEEAIKVFKEGVQTYWWNENGEQLFDLEDAWEYCYDEFACELDEPNDEIINKKIDEILLNKKLNEK